jgi:hypothetical protein
MREEQVRLQNDVDEDDSQILAEKQEGNVSPNENLLI